MDQISTTHRNDAQAEALLTLVASQLDSSMAMLTLHGPDGDPPRILTSLNMPSNLASAVAASVDHDLSVLPEANGSDWRGSTEWPPPVPRNDGGVARVTFLCRVAPLRTIALTACRAGAAKHSRDEQVSLDLKSWVEPFLALLWRAEHEHAQRDGLARAIDRFDFGIVLLDADGLPWFVNARAQRLLDAGDGIRRAGHAIAATDFEDAVRLQTAIRHDPGAGDSFHVLLLHRTRTRPLIAVVASLGGEQDLWRKAAIALYIIDPDRDLGVMVSALCRAHGLTVTESALAMHLVGGATVDAAASRMRIQTQTARAYLKQVFAKTGTHRQAELVRAILSSLVHIG